MQRLRSLPGRLVAIIALAYVAPMAAMWLIAPAVGWIAGALGAPSGGGWEFRMLGGIVPYPYPFTGRAAIGLALICGPPLLFVALWLWATTRTERFDASAR